MERLAGSHCRRNRFLSTCLVAGESLSSTGRGTESGFRHALGANGNSMFKATSTSYVPSGFAEARPRLVTRLAQASLVAMVCLSITAPVVRISSSLPWFKIEQLALPVILVAYLWFLVAGWARLIRPNFMFLVGAVYVLCI